MNSKKINIDKLSILNEQQLKKLIEIMYEDVRKKIAAKRSAKMRIILDFMILFALLGIFILFRPIAERLLSGFKTEILEFFKVVLIIFAAKLVCSFILYIYFFIKHRVAAHDLVVVVTRYDLDEYFLKIDEKEDKKETKENSRNIKEESKENIKE